MLPHLSKLEVQLQTPGDPGPAGIHHGRKFGVAQCTTDPDAVFGDDSIDAVVIATRHDSHAPLLLRALGANKHVFVEKPLAIDVDAVAPPSTISPPWSSAFATARPPPSSTWPTATARSPRPSAPGGAPPIPYDERLEVTRATLQAAGVG